MLELQLEEPVSRKFRLNGLPQGRLPELLCGLTALPSLRSASRRSCSASRSASLLLNNAIGPVLVLNLVEFVEFRS